MEPAGVIGPATANTTVISAGAHMSTVPAMARIFVNYALFPICFLLNHLLRRMRSTASLMA